MIYPPNLNQLHFPPCIPVPAVKLGARLNSLLDPFLPNDDFIVLVLVPRIRSKLVIRNLGDIRSLGVSGRPPREMRYEIIRLPEASRIEDRDVLRSGRGNADDQVFGGSVFFCRMDDEVGHKWV
jgi:hypothetical protein